MRAKLIIQATWLQQLGWDEPLGDEEVATWRRLQEELPLLETVRVPRWLQSDLPDSIVEIHGFCDASERAFAAVVYFRTVVQGRVVISLVQMKSKVAPLKQVSLPRLELYAATLLARLTASVRETLGLMESPTYLWTDSTVTFGWIRGHPTKLTTFVANRVAEIQVTLPNARWHHVPGRDNPADCTSRGVSRWELLAHPLWWQGPDIPTATADP